MRTYGSRSFRRYSSNSSRFRNSRFRCYYPRFSRGFGTRYGHLGSRVQQYIHSTRRQYRYGYIEGARFEAHGASFEHQGHEESRMFDNVNDDRRFPTSIIAWRDANGLYHWGPHVFEVMYT